MNRQQLRMAFEMRMRRRLTDQEFERLLRLGNGLFWDYREGEIGPYDLSTLQSGKLLLEHLSDVQR
jgi:hypothetical protein